jgi:uncharacterized protein YbjT (DUF2867 family)
MNRTVTVLAATGKSGRRVAAALRSAGHPVRPASRRGEVPFDWHDTATWPAILDRAESVYLVVPEDPGPVQPFVSAAEASGVTRIVLLSGRAPDTWRGRFGHAMSAGEDALRASGLNWTILQANNFMQNFTEDLFHAPLLAGRLALPIDDIPEPFVDVDDVAAAAARLLVDDTYAGRTYDLTGPTALTFAQAVSTISTATGRPIRYQPLTPDAYATELRAAGLSEAWVTELNGLFSIMREGHTATPTDDIEHLLGRPPTTFTDWVTRTAPTGIWTPASP